MQTSRDTYKQLRTRSKARGDMGMCEEEAAQRTLKYIAGKAAKGAVLTVGYVVCRKTGNLVLTLGLVLGSQVIVTEPMQVLAASMGAITALRFLVDASRLYTKSRSAVPYDVAAEKAFENDPDAIRH
jgi:hypothetical protein